MYVDAGVIPDYGNPDRLNALFSHLPFFGIKACFATCTEQSLPALAAAKKTFPHLRIFSRCTLRPNSLEHLKSEYGRCRGKFDLVAVQSTSADALNYAARDNRFHILSLRSRPEWGALNAGIASLAAQSGTGIEFPIDFLLKPESATSINIRMCRKSMTIARIAHAPLLLSSFARSPFELVGAKEIAFLAHSVFGIPPRVGAELTTTYPRVVLGMSGTTLETGGLDPGTNARPGDPDNQPEGRGEW